MVSVDSKISSTNKSACININININFWSIFSNFFSLLFVFIAKRQCKALQMLGKTRFFIFCARFLLPNIYVLIPEDHETWKQYISIHVVIYLLYTKNKKFELFLLAKLVKEKKGVSCIAESQFFVFMTENYAQ